MTQPIKFRFNQQRQYTITLRAIWNYAHQVVDPSYAKAKDIDFWELALRDSKVRQGVQQRLNNVAARNITLDHGGEGTREDKEKARLIKLMVEEIKNFRDARKRIATGVFNGTSYELILGRRRFVSLGGGPMLPWWIPFRLKHIDNRRFLKRGFKFEREDGKIVTRSRLLISVIDQRNDEGNSAVPGFNFVARPHILVTAVWENEESRLGFGRGLDDTLYFLTWVKGIVIREGLQGIERWAQGIVKQRFKPDVDSEKTNEERRDEMLAELERMKGRGAYVYQEGEEVDNMEGGATGKAMTMDFVEMINADIMGLTTGAVLASAGGQTTGSFARDKMGVEVQENVIEFDRDKVDENLTDDLGGLMIRMNRANFRFLGLDQAAPPKFRTMSEPIIKPSERVGVIKDALEIGIPLKKDEVYEGIQFTQPTEEDEIFVPVMPMEPEFPAPAPTAPAPTEGV